MTPFSTLSPNVPEPLVDEHEAAPVAGFTPRSLRKARQLGADHPPYIRRAGSRRVKYLMSAVRAWRDDRMVPSSVTNSTSATTNLDNVSNSTLTAPATAQRDAALAALDSDATVRYAVNDLIAARQRQQHAESARALMAEAFAATVAAGMTPTPTAVAATLAGLTESANAATERARTAAVQVREAAKRHHELLLTLRQAITVQADAHTVHAIEARRQAGSLRQPTRADELRAELLSAGTAPAKVHELVAAFPPEPGLEERVAEAGRKAEAARIADGKVAILRAILTKQSPLIDLEAVEAIAVDYPPIALALAQVREALGLELAEVTA